MHRAGNRHQLIEAIGQIRAVRPLYGEVADQWWDILDDLGIARHQEIDDDVDGSAAISSRDLANELKAPKLLTLPIAMSA